MIGFSPKSEKLLWSVGLLLVGALLAIGAILTYSIMRIEHKHSRFRASITSLGGECKQSEHSIDALRTIIVVWLDHCLVDEQLLDQMSDLGTLQEISLEFTNIEDNGVAKLSDLPHLAILDLDGTNISDAGLVHLAKCEKLISLDLRYTAVTNQGLKEISQLPNLQNIWLYGTDVDQAGIDEFERLNPTVNVHWQENRLARKFRKELVQLKAASISASIPNTPGGGSSAYINIIIHKTSLFSIQHVAIINELAEQLPVVLALHDPDYSLSFVNSFDELDKLVITSRDISDVDIAEIDPKLNVRAVLLNARNVSDKGLAHIATISNISEIKLSESGVTDTGLKSLGVMPQLEKLTLHGYQFTDAAIETVSQFQTLRILILDCQNISDAAIEDLRPSLKVKRLGSVP